MNSNFNLSNNHSPEIELWYVEELKKKLNQMQEIVRIEKQNTAKVQAELEEIKANLNKYAMKQIGSASEIPNEERISKLLIYILMEAYPRGLQIGVIALKINIAINSEHLQAPYHMLKAILEYYIRQGVVSFNGGQLYCLDHKMMFSMFG